MGFLFYEVYMSKEEKIKKVIEELKPFLNMDGGDAEFVKYDEKEKTVYIKLFGACAMCLMQDETLEYGLLGSIKEVVPEVEKIINVPLYSTLYPKVVFF